MLSIVRGILFSLIQMNLSKFPVLTFVFASANLDLLLKWFSFIRRAVLLCAYKKLVYIVDWDCFASFGIQMLRFEIPHNATDRKLFSDLLKRQKKIHPIRSLNSLVEFLIRRISELLLLFLNFWRYARICKPFLWILYRKNSIFLEKIAEAINSISTHSKIFWDQYDCSDTKHHIECQSVHRRFNEIAFGTGNEDSHRNKKKDRNENAHTHVRTLVRDGVKFILIVHQ